MSALKTVERSQKLKKLEKKLNAITRDFVNASNELQTVHRDLYSVSSKLNTMTIMREFQTSRIPFGALQGNKFKKVEALDSARDMLMQKCDDLCVMQNILENQLADGLDVADELEAVRAEFDKVDAELNSLTHEIDGIIKADKAEFDAEVAELTAKQDSLTENRDFLEQKTRDKGAEFNSIKDEIRKIEGGKKFSVKSIAKSGLKGGATLGLNTVKGVAKSGFTKVDPLSGGINKEDVGDTGAESIRFARQGMSKTVQGIKTANKTIKTTKRGIKTAKNAVKGTAKATKKAVTSAARTVMFVAKTAVKAVTHIAAAAMNPITWVILGILLVVVIITSAIVILMGGASSSSNSARASAGAIGLGDVSGQYMQGVELRNTAIDNAQAGHNALVNAASSNDLIFMQVTRTDGTVVNYSTGFATPAQKNQLNTAPWTYPLNENLLGVNDTIAIAYVLLQKRANQENGTTNQIYSVTFTQEIFNEIVGLSVTSNSTVYANQPCPGRNCRMGADEYGIYYYCNYDHDLHAVGVWYYTADTVMTALGFTADDKQWVSLTVTGFENNPQIN